MAINAHSLTTDEWTEVSDDITAVTVVQARNLGQGPIPQDGAEFIVAASEPAASDVGIALYNGETVVSTLLADWGTSGALYARAIASPSLVVVVDTA